MAMIEFQRYMSIGEALVVVSALEAGGYHPVYHNYHHAHNAYLQMMAFGGLIVLIPEQEYEAAQAWIDHIKSVPETEHDPITEHKYGMWKHAYSIAAFHSGPALLFVPLLWLPPLFAWPIFIAGLALFIIFCGNGVFKLEGIIFAIIYIILSMVGFLVFVVSPRILLMVWGALAAMTVGSSLYMKEFDAGLTIAVLSLLFPIALLWHAQYIAAPRERTSHVD